MARIGASESGFDGGLPGTNRPGLLSAALERVVKPATVDRVLGPLPRTSPPTDLPSPPRPAHPPAFDTGAALDDPATSEAFRRHRRRSRVYLARSIVGLAVYGAVVAVAVVAILRHHRSPVLDVAGLGALFSPALLIAAIFGSAQRLHRSAVVRRVLASSPWVLVEVVTVTGGPNDRRQRVAVVLDPHDAQPIASWLCLTAAPGWPAVDERVWAYLAADTERRHGVLATPDRSTLVLLGQRDVTSDAKHVWARHAVVERWRLGPPSGAGAVAVAVADPTVADSLRIDPPEARGPKGPMSRAGRLAIGAILVALGGYVVVLLSQPALVGANPRRIWLLRVLIVPTVLGQLGHLYRWMRSRWSKDWSPRPPSDRRRRLRYLRGSRRVTASDQWLRPVLDDPHVRLKLFFGSLPQLGGIAAVAWVYLPGSQLLGSSSLQAVVAIGAVVLDWCRIPRQIIRDRHTIDSAEPAGAVVTLTSVRTGSG